MVSEAWVKQSVAPHVTVRDGVGYGYSWWVNTARQPFIFEAVGRGGQRAAVLPDKDLVVVFNSGGADTDQLAPFLFKAIKSDGPLPEDPRGARRLRTRLTEARQPRAPSASTPTSAPSPALLRAISARRYVMDANPLNLTRLSLAFSGPTEARAILQLFDAEYRVPIGLDGRYRFSSTGPAGLPMAARAHWVSASELVLDLDTVANINHFTIRVAFQDEQVTLRVDEATGEVNDLVVGGRVDSKK